MHQQVKTEQEKESVKTENQIVGSSQQSEKIVLNPEPTEHHRFVPHGQPGHVHQSIKEFAEEKKKEQAQHPHIKQNPEPTNEEVPKKQEANSEDQEALRVSHRTDDQEIAHQEFVHQEETVPGIYLGI